MKFWVPDAVGTLSMFQVPLGSIVWSSSSTARHPKFLRYLVRFKKAQNSGQLLEIGADIFRRHLNPGDLLIEAAGTPNEVKA